MNDNQQSPWGQKPPTPKKTIRPFIILVGVVVVITLIIGWILSRGLSQGQGASLLYDLLLLALVGAGLIGHVVSNPGQSLRNIAGWVIIFGILGLGYSLWNGSGRLAGEFNPSAGNINQDTISFRADLSGHFVVRAKINDKNIDFLVDTGATDVALTLEDAATVGYKIDDLSFDIPVSTANGTAYAAAIMINKIEIGPISVSNVRASVVRSDMDTSLLGMSFLNKLKGYEVNGDLLTLYP